MMNAAYVIHYVSIGIMTAICAIGVGLGQGAVSLACLRANNTQPMAGLYITRIAIFGMVLLEFAAIAGVTFALFLLFGTKEINLAISLAHAGIAAAICIAGCMVGFACYLPAQESCHSAARQPFFSANIMRFMLLTQSIIQTPIIFAFIVGMFIRTQALGITDTLDGIRLLAAGLCIGVGSIGPALGLAQFAKTACAGIGMNRESYTKLMSFTFISQAIIETPLLFSLVVSLLIVGSSVNGNITQTIALASAAFCAGLGTLGPSISSGRTAAAACKEIARNPHTYSLLSRISMLGQGIIDSNAIYSFLVALLIYFFR